MPRPPEYSTTAQTVALMRSLATASGAADDELATRFLAPPWRAARSVLRIAPGPVRRHRSIAYVAARTRFFDDEVSSALDDGAGQVVVLGAGYDTRAWRLARPGARFFEVDLPATQADKRRRAPAGGPTYVTADLVGDGLGTALAAAGFAPAVPSMFTAEGLTMYLDPDDLAAALRTVAEVGSGAGNRLAVNFGVGFADSDEHVRLDTRLGRRLVAARREPFRFEPDPADVTPFLERCGWRVERLLTGPELAEAYLTGTPFDGVALNPRACACSCVVGGA